MNKLFTFLAGVLLLSIISCNNQHEVVPPPLKVAELECSCKADIDGIPYEYSDTCKYDNTKTIATGTSTAVYWTDVRKPIISNAAFTEGFQLKMRTLEWNDDGSNLPTVEEWKAFFTNNMSPSYYIDDALSPNGVSIEWTDPTGVVWSSDTVSGCSAIDFLYTSMAHDSDQTGNYMKFKGIFNCPLRNASGDTICVENGIIKTSFRRE